MYPDDLIAAAKVDAVLDAVAQVTAHVLSTTGSLLSNHNPRLTPFALHMRLLSLSHRLGCGQCRVADGIASRR